MVMLCPPWPIGLQCHLTFEGLLKVIECKSDDNNQLKEIEMGTYVKHTHGKAYITNFTRQFIRFECKCLQNFTLITFKEKCCQFSDNLSKDNLSAEINICVKFVPGCITYFPYIF